MKLDISIKDIDGEGYLCIKLADLTVLKRSKAFKPPTIQDVKKYCKERNNRVNAVQFMNHYESNGWMVGKVKMKSWQAAVRTWENLDYGNGKEESKGTNLADPPPEIFGIRSETAITREQYLRSKET